MIDDFELLATLLEMADSVEEFRVCIPVLECVFIEKNGDELKLVSYLGKVDNDGVARYSNGLTQDDIQRIFQENKAIFEKLCNAAFPGKGLVLKNYL